MSWKTSVLALSLAVAAALGSVTAQAEPDYSVKTLMKKINANVLNGDTKGVGAMFDAVKAKGKPDFKDWGAMCDKAKAAADKGDLDGLKATCKPCHDQYRDAYKTKFGSKAP
jgi:hypothetical protein